jgi:hypothetical protein
MNSTTPIIVAGVGMFFSIIALAVAYWYLYIRDGVDDLNEYLPPTSGPTSGPFPGPAPGPSPPPVSDSSDVIEQIQDVITDLENVDVQSLDITSTCIGNGLENGCELQEE